MQGSGPTRPDPQPPPAGERIQVVVLEDEPLFRDLLGRALHQHPDLSLVGSYAEVASLLADAPALAPQVAVLDIELADGWTGIRAGLELRRILPGVGILLLSNHADAELLAGVAAERLAGWSYLLKRSVSDLATLVRAIEGAAAGLVVLDPVLVQRRRRQQAGPLARLTPRQFQVLGLIAQGYTNGAIADQLGLAEKSVENQINLLYQSLGIEHGQGSLHPRVQAVLAVLGRSPTS